MIPWFSEEVAVMRRILKMLPLLLVGALATGCSAAEDLTGPGLPHAALASAQIAPAGSAPGTERSRQKQQLSSNKRRGTRYAMGAN